MPALYGSVTPSAAAVATAASAALPPRASTSMPTCEASRSTDDTAPPEPVMAATLGRSVGLPCHPRSLPGAVGAAVVCAPAVAGSRDRGNPTTRAPRTHLERAVVRAV